MQSLSNGTFSAVGVPFIGCGWACTSCFSLNQIFPDKTLPSMENMRTMY